METVDEFVTGKEESAIIFSVEGEPRLILPMGKDNEPVNEGSIQVLRVTWFLDRPDLIAMADEALKLKQ